jgi:hypothetical protein
LAERRARDIVARLEEVGAALAIAHDADDDDVRHEHIFAANRTGNEA